MPFRSIPFICVSVHLLCVRDGFFLSRFLLRMCYSYLTLFFSLFWLVLCKSAVVCLFSSHLNRREWNRALRAQSTHDILNKQGERIQHTTNDVNRYLCPLCRENPFFSNSLHLNLLRTHRCWMLLLLFLLSACPISKASNSTYSGHGMRYTRSYYIHSYTHTQYSTFLTIFVKSK